MKNISPNGFIEFDEHEDAVHSLEELSNQLLGAQSDAKSWKFALILGCNALNSALVCALNDTAGVACLTRRSRAATLKWFEESRIDPNAKYPEQRLESPLALVRLARRDRGLCSQVAFSLQKMRDIRKAFNLRNRFVHFLPASWSIEVAGLPRIVLTLAQVSDQLLCATGKTYNRVLYEEDLHVRLKRAICDIVDRTKALGIELGEPIVESE